MLTNMAYSKVEELYKKEMAKLQGHSSQKEEAERRMKERHDLNIQQPFPEETTPSKDNAEEMKEEQENAGIEVKSAKRVKTIASKKQSKRPRVEERAETEAEPSVTSSAEPMQNSKQSKEQSDEHVGMYMTILEPVQAVPISMKAPEIIFWDSLRDNGKDFFRLKRNGGAFEAYSTWGRVIRGCSREDIEEMYKVGMKLYEPVLKGTEENLFKVAMEYLCMMFDPDKVVHRIKDLHHESEELASLPKSQVRGRLLGTEELHKLMLLNKFSTASSKLVLLEEINTAEHAGWTEDYGKLDDNDGSLY
ncbi:hypothetical protein L6452_00724 [Arctium lappa]|uniref:Uncharacterized protein n=1 Tax=Arctium lappa TaxID=4217 RepID=A0ACB9FFI7_ARCLA|nr:hypothetical protein L6452_00724 [Arctium lappa]